MVSRNKEEGQVLSNYITQAIYIIENNKSFTNIDHTPNSSELNGGKSIFRPFVVLALPGVNLFRRFSTYRRLPQADPAPKDKLEKELDRLTNKIVSSRQQLFSILDFLKLDSVLYPSNF